MTYLQYLTEQQARRVKRLARRGKTARQIVRTVLGPNPVVGQRIEAELLINDYRLRVQAP